MVLAASAAAFDRPNCVPAVVRERRTADLCDRSIPSAVWGARGWDRGAIDGGVEAAPRWTAAVRADKWLEMPASMSTGRAIIRIIAAGAQTATVTMFSLAWCWCSAAPPPRRRRLRRDPTHGRPMRRWGSSDRTNQASGVPERRPARSAAARTRSLKPQGPCWPSAAQKRLLRYPCGSGMHGARMVAAIGRASIMAHESAWGARWGRRTKHD